MKATEPLKIHHITLQIKAKSMSLIMKNKLLLITMPDGSVWSVPVQIIANNRAVNFAHEFNGDINKSLIEDTYPLFEEDEFEIEDWAANNMNWSDVESHAIKVSSGYVDFQNGWINGKKRIIDAGGISS